MTTLSSTELRAAVERKVPIGTPFSELETRLKDSILYSYPVRGACAVVSRSEIQCNHQSLDKAVAASFGYRVRFLFDDEGRLARVDVKRLLTMFGATAAI